MYIVCQINIIFQNMFVQIQGKISKARETDAIQEK